MTRLHSAWRLAAAGAAATLVLASCGGDDSSDSSSSSSDNETPSDNGSAAPQGDGTLVVGQLLPTSGDLAFLGRSFEARWILDIASKGVLLTGPSGRRIPLGVVPASGVLSFSVPTSALDPGTQAKPWYLQTFARDPLDALQTGGAFVVTVIDPMF